MVLRQFLSGLTGLLVCLVCGCASWEVPAGSLALPAPPVAAGVVGLEIELVRVPVGMAPRLSELWEVVDEQRFEHSLRRQLASNGLRCGVIGTQLPSILREILAAEGSPLEQVAAGASPEESQVLGSFRALRGRAGRRYKIVAAPRIREQMVVLVSEDEHVRAIQFQQAQGLFSLRATPQIDARGRLELTPLVEHGPARQRVVPGDASFLFDTTRDQLEFEFLRLEATLSLGETLLCGPTDDLKGLGQWYFGGSEPEGAGSLLLIRLVESDQRPDHVAQRPLATAID
jgi:hypothetical protein